MITGSHIITVCRVPVVSGHYCPFLSWLRFCIAFQVCLHCTALKNYSTKGYRKETNFLLRIFSHWSIHDRQSLPYCIWKPLDNAKPCSERTRNPLLLVEGALRNVWSHMSGLWRKEVFEMLWDRVEDWPWVTRRHDCAQLRKHPCTRIWGKCYVLPLQPELPDWLKAFFVRIGIESSRRSETLPCVYPYICCCEPLPYVRVSSSDSQKEARRLHWKSDPSFLVNICVW